MNQELQSGDYFDAQNERGPLPPGSAWPRAVLLSRVVEIPDVATAEQGVDVRVSIEHRYAFNSSDDVFVDHGVVAFAQDGPGVEQNVDAWRRVLPNPMTGTAEEIACGGKAATDGPEAGCFEGNVPGDFCAAIESTGLAGDTGVFAQDTVMLPSVPPGRYRLLFRLQYDCRNFSNGIPAMDDAWALANVTLEVAIPDDD